MEKIHTKNLTNQMNSILEASRFSSNIILVCSLMLIVASIYYGNVVYFGFAIAFNVIGFLIQIMGYVRSIALGQISILSYMESKDKD